MNQIYVFDLDGTLVDSMSYFAKGILSIPEEAGIPTSPELLKIITPLGYTKAAEYYRQELGMQESIASIVRRIEDKLVYEYTHNIRPKEGVVDYLRTRYAEGARLFVLTASPHLVTDVCLQRNGLFDLFEQVWSVEDFALSKSDPRIFFEVASKIGCKVEDIHYFDDSLIALRNAKIAGYRTYAVYDAHSDEEITEMKREYNVFVRSFAEL